jgi:hypothetical protein
LRIQVKSLKTQGKMSDVSKTANPNPEEKKAFLSGESFCSETRKRLVSTLRTFRDGEAYWWNEVRKAAKGIRGLGSLPHHSTLSRMLKDSYNPERMRHQTFHKLVACLRELKLWPDSSLSCDKDPELCLHLGLSRFLEINEPPVGLGEGFQGCYQGYRWSVTQPGEINRCGLEITYDPKTQLLLSKETTRYLGGAYGVFEGVVMAAAPDKGRYIIARERRGKAAKGQSLIRSLHLTMLAACYQDDEGNVVHIDGVVLGLSETGPFLRQIVFKRLAPGAKPIVDIIALNALNPQKKEDRATFEKLKSTIKDLNEKTAKIDIGPYQLLRATDVVEGHRAAETETPSAESSVVDNTVADDGPPTYN